MRAWPNPRRHWLLDASKQTQSLLSSLHSFHKTVLKWAKCVPRTDGPADVERLWVEATEGERRVLVEELLESLTVYPTTWKSQ